MSSSKFFKLLLAAAGSDLNYQLASADISGFSWDSVPLNSQLGDLSVTEGDPITAPNIGGKLKDDWSQNGFSGSEGNFKLSVPKDTPGDFPTQILNGSYGLESTLTNPTTVTLTGMEDTQTGTWGSGTGDHASLSGFYCVSVDNAGGTNARKGIAAIFQPAAGDGVIQFPGSMTIASGDIVTVEKQNDLNTINADYYHVIAQAPDGYCHLLQYVQFTTDINLTEASKLLEATVNVKALGKNVDNNDSAMQVALKAAADGEPCPDHYTALVTNVAEVVMFDPITNIDSDTDLEQTILTGNGLVDFKTEHKREKAIVTGNASVDGKIAIDEVSNSIKVMMSIYDLDLQTTLREYKKDQTIFALYAADSDCQLQFIFPKCRISGASNADDNNGLHTVTFTVECNQYCASSYSRIKGLN